MSVKIIYEDVAVGAAEAATVNSTEPLPISNVALIPYGSDNERLASFECNQWILDGSKQIIDDKKVAFWSVEQSNADCTFDDPPTLTISLDGSYSSPGIYFYFDGAEGDYCSEIELTWYGDDSELANKIFYPDSREFYCEQKVSLFDKLVIKLLKTHLPNYYAKISQVFFGVVRNFERDELRSVKITEGLNVISEDTEINTLDFTLDSADNIAFVFQQKQPVNAYNGKALIGCFYINESSRKSASTYDISCIDALGVMDDEPFAAALYSEYPAKTLVQDILAGHFTLEFDEQLENETVSGYIPDCTKREALQQIVFAIRATIDTSGTRGIRIRRLTEGDPENVPIERLYMGGSVATEASVTEVRLTSHAYTPSGSGETIEVGGNTYYHKTTVFTKTNPEVTAATKPNVIEIRDATLVNNENVEAILEHVYQYYQRRQKHSVKIVMDEETPGDYITTSTPWGSTITGTITSMSIRLSGIAAADCEVVGT